MLLLKFLELARPLGLTTLVVSLDDSLGPKHKDTRHLEAVAYHHDHNASGPGAPRYVNGFVYVALHIHFGPFGFTFDTRLYLREKTVRQLNRQRSAETRLHYRSKYHLAQEMLSSLAALLPPGYQVYVTFDSCGSLCPRRSGRSYSRSRPSRPRDCGAPPVAPS